MQFFHQFVNRLARAQITIDTTLPTVTSISVTPNPFHPPTQKTKINYTLSEACYVTIKIFQGTTLRRTLFTNRLQAAGLASIIWNGKDNNGLYVSPGTYTIKIYVTDKAGNRASIYPIIQTVVVT